MMPTLDPSDLQFAGFLDLPGGEGMALRPSVFLNKNRYLLVKDPSKGATEPNLAPLSQFPSLEAGFVEANVNFGPAIPTTQCLLVATEKLFSELRCGRWTSRAWVRIFERENPPLCLQREARRLWWLPEERVSDLLTGVCQEALSAIGKEVSKSGNSAISATNAKLIEDTLLRLEYLAETGSKESRSIFLMYAEIVRRSEHDIIKRSRRLEVVRYWFQQEFPDEDLNSSLVQERRDSGRAIKEKRSKGWCLGEPKLAPGF